MYMEAYYVVTYLGVHVLVDLCPVEHGSIVLVDVDNSQSNWVADGNPSNALRIGIALVA